MTHFSRIGRSTLSGLTKLAACLILPILVGCAHDDPAKQMSGLPQGTGFFTKESNGPAGNHKYSVFIPRDYNAAAKYPTIVFLHGVGEQGGDGIGCRTVGLGPEVARRNGNFPFIVVFPQTGGDWCTDQSDKIMMDALRDVEKSYSVDEDRIALTGMSSGGKGTWVLGARHPEIFSCLVPMAGFAATDAVPKLTKYPIWALHNDGDFIVNSGDTKNMVERLQKAGASPKSTIYPEGGHNCWDAAYSEGALFQWMMAQHRAGSQMRAQPTVMTTPAMTPGAMTPGAMTPGAMTPGAVTPAAPNQFIKRMGSN